MYTSGGFDWSKVTGRAYGIQMVSGSPARAVLLLDDSPDRVAVRFSLDGTSAFCLVVADQIPPANGVGFHLSSSVALEFVGKIASHSWWLWLTEDSSPVVGIVEFFPADYGRSNPVEGIPE